MKCRFDSTGTLGGLKTFFLIIVIFSFSTAAACLPEVISVSTVCFIIFLLSSAAAAAVSALCGGCILACENQIVIYHKFLSRKVLVSRIPYKEIEYADYRVDSQHSRIGFIFYNFTLKISLVNGKEISLQKTLDIPEKLPIENPDKYKEYIDRLPLMRMCRMINRKIREIKFDVLI